MVYLAGAKQAVDTADTYFGEIAKGPAGASVEAKHRIGQRPLIARMPKAGGKPLEARAEYARWIVDCPNCHNAEFVFEDGLFLCSSCQNSDVGGAIRRVKLPQERKQIETLLGKRNIINRHWFPWETIGALQNENSAHGLEVA